MMKNILYTVPGSSTCQKAESHLRSLGVEFEVVVVGATGELENVGRDIQVQRLPFFVTPQRTYQGIKEIIESKKE